MKHLIVVLSDMEMGAGGPTDDCPHSDDLGRLLLRYNQGELRKIPIDFVFNGDTFDFLKTPYFSKYPHHIHESIALAKFAAIERAHTSFLRSLNRLLSHGEAPRRAHFVVGNHDPELLFPAVQSTLRSGLGERINFPGLSIDLGEVHIEHGSQGDPLFRMEPTQPFVEHNGQRLLNLPWGAVGLLEVAMPYHPWLYDLDRTKPKAQLFDLLPDARTLFMKSASEYWTKTYWQGLLVERDPLKRPSWPMLKEVVRRLVSADAEVSIEDSYREALKAHPGRVFVLGHQHEQRQTQTENKLLLQVGCLRDEYQLRPGGLHRTKLPRSCLELHMEAGVVRGVEHIPFEPPLSREARPLRALKPILKSFLEDLEIARQLRLPPSALVNADLSDLSDRSEHTTV